MRKTHTMKMRICIVGFVAVLLSPLFAGEPEPPKGGAPAEAPPAAEAPLMSVDDVPRAPLEEGVFLQSGDLKIPFAAVKKIEDAYMAAQKKDNPKYELSVQKLTGVRREMAMQLLQYAVMDKYVQDNKLAGAPEDLEKELVRIRETLKAQGSSYEQALAENGQTDEDFRRLWSAHHAIETQLGKTVTEDAVNKAVAEGKETAALRRVSHILFMYKGSAMAENTEPPITRSKEEAKAAAEDALKKLKGGADFAALAKESSDCPSKKEGGDLNFFPLKGEGAMVDAFGEAAYKLAKVGDVSDVVETPFGFHVIKLTAFRENEYRDEVRQGLVSDKFGELMGQLMVASMKNAKFNANLVPPPDPNAPKEDEE
jgi:parvulin-like peptidyl-prolyl isomerase